MNQYWKFFSQLLVTVLAAVLVAFEGDEFIAPNEWINIVILALGAFAVLGAGNLPGGFWEYAKFWVSALTAGCVYLASIITSGGLHQITIAQWIQFGLACLGAVGVVAVPGPKVEVHSQV